MKLASQTCLIISLSPVSCEPIAKDHCALSLTCIIKVPLLVLPSRWHHCAELVITRIIVDSNTNMGYFKHRTKSDPIKRFHCIYYATSRINVFHRLRDLFHRVNVRSSDTGMKQRNSLRSNGPMRKDPF